MNYLWAILSAFVLILTAPITAEGMFGERDAMLNFSKPIPMKNPTHFGWPGGE